MTNHFLPLAVVLVLALVERLCVAQHRQLGVPTDPGYDVTPVAESRLLEVWTSRRREALNTVSTCA